MKKPIAIAEQNDAIALVGVEMHIGAKVAVVAGVIVAHAAIRPFYREAQATMQLTFFCRQRRLDCEHFSGRGATGGMLFDEEANKPGIVERGYVEAVGRAKVIIVGLIVGGPISAMPKRLLFRNAVVPRVPHEACADTIAKFGVEKALEPIVVAMEKVLHHACKAGSRDRVLDLAEVDPRFAAICATSPS
ncbi:hypothetical protein [Pelagerythrobacter marinus]|uniref:hypothetical protein n=1 Tax=Pelagerythrobacter marinus TaxID=538382 RepID=UPI0020372341|nr:hypothetical protein [Pelagerythrobacter marinus]USA38414.1 hypothetical protein NCF86_08700 [Pelagerythrobacter marinus]WPZ07562.1 hypothetical protein T8T98_03345 [Pelagerythrobacter marinus]